MSQKIEILYVVQSSAHSWNQKKYSLEYQGLYVMTLIASWVEIETIKVGSFFSLRTIDSNFAHHFSEKLFLKKKKLLDNINLSSLKNSYFHVKSISVLNSQSSLRKGQWLIKLKLIRSSATANIWMIIYKQSLINLSWQNKELASAWTNYVYVLAPQLSKRIYHINKTTNEFWSHLNYRTNYQWY